MSAVAAQAEAHQTLSPSMGLTCQPLHAPRRRDLQMQANKPAPRKAVGHNVGEYGTIRSAMAFMRWAIEQNDFPTPEAVIARFDCCRATAYRWTAALAETYGMDPEGRHQKVSP